MLTYSLGTDALTPIKSLVYAYAYILKYHTKVAIQVGETIVLDTRVIFTHGINEHLDVTLVAGILTKNISLQKISVDDHPLRESSVSNQNRSLKLHLKNNDTIVQFINTGELLCEVISANINTGQKLLISELDMVFASHDEVNILDGVVASTDEINYVDVTTPGIAEAEKALITNSTNDITGLNILSSTQIGINELVPASQLHIKQSADDATGGIRFEESGDTNYWGVFMDATDILQFHHNGTDLGFVNTAGTDIAMNFTGQHRSSTDNVLINTTPDNYIGMIVSATGTYKNLNDADITINDALPSVDLSLVDNDKTVFGVISDREEAGESRTFQTGIFATYFDKNNGDERLFINSVGEGMVWVCSKGGNLVNGDLLSSSSAAGYGQLQSDDLMHSYTVAKITQDCDFSSPERYVDLNGLEVDQATYDADSANHYKCNFVGCTYHCG